MASSVRRVSLEGAKGAWSTVRTPGFNQRIALAVTDLKHVMAPWYNSANPRAQSNIAQDANLLSKNERSRLIGMIWRTKEMEAEHTGDTSCAGLTTHYADHR
jgi:hypothetical protein